MMVTRASVEVALLPPRLHRTPHPNLQGDILPIVAVKSFVPPITVAVVTPVAQTMCARMTLARDTSARGVSVRVIRPRNAIIIKRLPLKATSALGSPRAAKEIKRVVNNSD